MRMTFARAGLGLFILAFAAISTIAFSGGLTFDGSQIEDYQIAGMHDGPDIHTVYEIRLQSASIAEIDVFNDNCPPRDNIRRFEPALMREDGHLQRFKAVGARSYRQTRAAKQRGAPPLVI